MLHSFNFEPMLSRVWISNDGVFGVTSNQSVVEASESVRIPEELPPHALQNPAFFLLFSMLFVKGEQ